MLRQTFPLAQSLVAASRASSYFCSPHASIVALRTARSLSTLPRPQSRIEIEGRRIDEAGAKGTEGRHYADTNAHPPVPPFHLESPAITGDWVLFHPVYTQKELKAVEPSTHRNELTLSDKAANGLVKLCRWGFDVVSGYKHKTIPLDSQMSLQELREKGYIMTEQGWLNRCIFLETIAGIPGMAAATIRHLHSLRLMRRDAGWIHTLLEEAENERMHLMTFLSIRKPGIMMRALILAAQGVFYNVFFLSYLISPRICHRFVGYLEEEAVKTYSSLISDLEGGRFPEWVNQPAPEIAKDYWRLDKNATYTDMIYAIRSDETTHRFVNHSLANLKKGDVNPFAFREPDMSVKGIKYGFERDEAAQYVRESQKLLEKPTA